MRSTNLQMMRFIAAVLVIFSHSFALTQGDSSNEWLYKATNGQLDIGAISVALFFLCAGYLSLKSLEKRDSFKEYLKNRCVRIMPPMMGVVSCCVILGAFVTDLSLKEYFTSKTTYLYLLNGFFILQHELPGVFSGAVYCPTVNGSLWTMPMEFLCNMVCYPAKKMKLLDEKVLAWTIIPMVPIAALAMYVGRVIPMVLSALRPCILFYIGMLYYVYRDKIQLKKKFAIVAFVLFMVLAWIGLINIGMFLCFPYIMITCWFSGRQFFEKVSVLGQFSYGMYLWGFPIQQLVCEMFNWDMPFYLNFLISLPLDITLGVLTYYLIEKPISERMRNKRKQPIIST